MNELITCMSKSKKNLPGNKLKDDSGLSKNHSKSVKYRLRVQQQKEAEETIKQFKAGDADESYSTD